MSMASLKRERMVLYTCSISSTLNNRFVLPLSRSAAHALTLNPSRGTMEHQTTVSRRILDSKDHGNSELSLPERTYKVKRRNGIRRF